MASGARTACAHPRSRRGADALLLVVARTIEHSKFDGTAGTRARAVGRSCPTLGRQRSPSSTWMQRARRVRGGIGSIRPRRSASPVRFAPSDEVTAVNCAPVVRFRRLPTRAASAVPTTSSIGIWTECGSSACTTDPCSAGTYNGTTRYTLVTPSRAMSQSWSRRPRCRVGPRAALPSDPPALRRAPEP